MLSFSQLKFVKSLPFLLKAKKHQWLDEEYLTEIQEQKLRRLINHAYQNAPFYHNMFDSLCIKPNEIKKVIDLQKLPILTKENVKNNFPNNIVDKNANLTDCSIRSTTGSTGVPLKIVISPEIEYYRTALLLFVFFEWGLRLKDKVISIRHAPFFSNNNLIGKAGILNWENVSIFDPIESIAEYLKKQKPNVIASYPSLHFLLTEELLKLNATDIKPRFITAHGETLTDSYRNRFREIYNTDVFTQYSTVETGSIAFECEHHCGYHIISDVAIIELIKDGKNVPYGNQGEIVVTILDNYTMPLIRYNLEDVGIVTEEKCSCGRGYPLIKSIEGRSDDFLTLPSGRKISPRTINVIEDIPGVSRYQTIQEEKNRITINLVKGSGFSEKTITEIENHIKTGCFGEDIKIEIKLVKELPVNRRGKLRAVISNVKDS